MQKKEKKIETSDIETIHKIEKINKSKFFEINKIGKEKSLDTRIR